MRRCALYMAAAFVLLGAFPVFAQEKEKEKVPSLRKEGESNPNPHFRRCMMKDMVGTWEMVGVSGKVLEVFPNDPICHKYQWIQFGAGTKFRYIYYKDEKNLETVTALLQAAEYDRSYSLSSRGILTFTQPDGKVYQLCMISTADDGQSKAGDMLLTSFHARKPALFRLFRKMGNL